MSKHTWVNLGAVLAGGVVVIGLTGAGCSSNATSASNNNGVATQSNNQTHPPQADVNTSTASCAPDEIGDWHYKGTVTNNSSQASMYDINVSFQSADGKTQYSTGADLLDHVDPGQTATFDAIATSTSMPATGVTCKLTTVDRSEALK